MRLLGREEREKSHAVERNDLQGNLSVIIGLKKIFYGLQQFKGTAWRVTHQRQVQGGVVLQCVGLHGVVVVQNGAVVCSGYASMIIIEGRITARAAPTHTAIVGTVHAGILVRARTTLRKVKVAQIANLIDMFQNSGIVLADSKLYGIRDLDMLTE